jgi:hypothetical protein
VPRTRVASLKRSEGIVLSTSNALGSTISVGIGAFGSRSTLTTFTGVADGTEVNGVTVDGGPRIANNIAPPNIVSVGNSRGVLSMTLPSSVDRFGYGYAVLDTVAVTAATTISLFSGATPVGSLSYDGAPDPTFSGGAGIVSGLAVGAKPNGTLGGGQGFSLHVTPGLGITAFGAVITLAPFDGQVPANIFRLIVGCPDIPCFSVGNPANPSPRVAPCSSESSRRRAIRSGPTSHRRRRRCRGGPPALPIVDRRSAFGG